MSRKIIYNSGDVINNIEIIKEVESYQGRRFEFKCTCGNVFITNITKIKNGHTKSCGCLARQILINRNKSHNLAHTRLYSIYTNMKTRCYNKNSPSFMDYGNRGISICQEWINSFMSFYNWAINNGYSDVLSIDRINNDGNYEPSNCRWTTASIQTRNSRLIKSNNTSGYRGITFAKDRKKWRARIGIDNGHIRLGSFDTAIEAAKAYNQYVIDNNLEHTINKDLLI